MNESEFEKINCNFKADYDPKSKKAMAIKFIAKDFKQLFGGDEISSLEHNNELFKLSAKNEI